MTTNHSAAQSNVNINTNYGMMNNELIIPENLVGYTNEYFELAMMQGSENEALLTSHIWLGNPGDTNYNPSPVVAIYLATSTDKFSTSDYWYCHDHNGRPLVCRVVRGTFRTTDARLVNSSTWGSVSVDPDIIDSLDARLSWRQMTV